LEQRIRERYHAGILEEAMQRYGIEAERIRTLDAFESYIYEYQRDDGNYILRISHSFRRSAKLIAGEVDWINYLADNGIPAARAVTSLSGKLVEAVADGQGEYFLVTAFVRAAGQKAWDVWSPEIYQPYGRLLGSMHALAQNYQPADVTWKRPEWDDDSMEFVDHYLPESEMLVKQKYRLLCDHLHALPKDPTIYGIIHQDAHPSNFVVDERGKITLFDFDEAAYSWYANDIAIALFYSVMGEPDLVGFTKEFMIRFLSGYRQVYALDNRWLQEIPVFLKMREIELYAVMHRDFDVNNIDDAWCASFMQGRKEQIERDVPFIPVANDWWVSELSG
jgi:amicoumacin kinase